MALPPPETLSIAPSGSAGGCLDEQAVLRFLDRQLSSVQLAQVEAHVDDCDLCRSVLGFAAQDEVVLPTEPTVESTPSLAPGQMVDHFLIKRFVGKGGMGEIYLAIDTQLRRRIALKLISRDRVDSDEARQRLLIEARATARFSHPAIVSIYSVGEIGGRPYLALEYLEGESLRSHLSSRRVDLQRSLEIGMTVAEALQVAHAHKVVHRDLKPENIMICDDGRVCVLDFGLAQLAPHTSGSLTDSGQIASFETTAEQDVPVLGGTPAYMAPEQWRGKAASEASDVWALGVLLYEIISGHRPYPDASAVSYAMKVCDAEPVPSLPVDTIRDEGLSNLLSRCLDKNIAARPSAQQVVEQLRLRLGRSVPDKIEQIEQAALSWEKSGRSVDRLWDSPRLGQAQDLINNPAAELSPLISRFLTTSLQQAHRSVHARNRRLRSTVLGITVLALVALGAAGVAVWQGQRARQAQARAEAERAVTMIEAARAAMQRGHLLEARARVRSAVEQQDSTLARVLWWQLKGQAQRWRQIFGMGVFDLAMDSVHQRLAVAGQDHNVYLVDLRTGARRSLRGHRDQVFDLAFDAEGERLASGTWGGELRLWQLEQNSARVLRTGGPQIMDLVFLGKPARLIAAFADGSICAWALDRAGPEAVLRAAGGAVDALAADATGALLWVGEQGVQWIDQAGVAQVLLTSESLGARPRSLWLDDERLIVGLDNGQVQIWDRQTLVKKWTKDLHREQVHRVIGLADGSVISASHDGQVKRWSPRADQVAVLSRLSAFKLGLAVDPHSHLLAIAGKDRSVTVLDLNAPPPHDPALAHNDGVVSLAFDSSGQWLASGGYDASVRIWRARDGVLTRTLRGPRDSVLAVASEHGTSQWAAACRDGSIWLYDDRSDEPVRVVSGHLGGVTSVDFSPDDTRLASASYDGSVGLWEVGSGRRLLTLRGHEGPVLSVRFVDADTLLSAGSDGSARLWSISRARIVQTIAISEQALRRALPCDGGKAIVSAGDDGRVRLTDVASGHSRELGRHDGRVYGLSLDESQGQVFSVGADRRVRAWSLGEEEPRVLAVLDSEINDVSLGPKGQIAVADDDGTVRVLDSQRGWSRWQTVLLQASPARLATHAGWRDLDSSAEAKKRTARWQQMLVARARLASATDDGRWLCVFSEAGKIELWSTVGDRRIFAQSQDAIVQVLAIDQGCATRAAGVLRLYDRQGAFRELAGDVRVVAPVVGTQELLSYATDSHLYVVDRSGQVQERRRLSSGTSAIAWSERSLAIGNEGGRVTIYSVDAPTRPGRVVEHTPASAVRALALAPSGLLVAGFASGELGLWSIDDHNVLLTRRLHGPVDAIAQSPGRLVIASQLGSVVGPIDTLNASWAALRDEIQASVGVRWQGGRVVLAAARPQE